jgi:membrane-bound lytic murein transglycosylase F
LVYEAPPKCSKDWSEIADDSMLTVLAENSPASYFIYKGRNMGYEYELLHEFAKDMNVRLQVLMVNNLDEMQMKLDSCIGDIIACNLTVTPERKYAFNFSTPHLTTHQVLVQRDHPDSLITNFKQLRGKRIHVWQNSSFYENLVSLNEQQNLGIHIVKTEGDIISEELIRQVSEGEINYTVSDENVAKISMHYYDNLDISLAMSEDEEIAFAMRKGSEKLRDTINYWLNAKENQSTIGEVKRKYFKRRNLTSKANQNYSSLTGDQISPYDDVIKKESELIGWDWRLVSAIIYQESKFETWKRSWAGAFGIFQFMPETAEQYGISENSSPEAQIHAGCRKLNKNFNQWLEEVPDTNEAIMFTLATFNCGRGHIDDARALCDKYDLDKNKWDDNVAKMMLNLSNPKYYKDPVVRNGYCRGRETFKYPAEIMQRYEEYKSAFPDEPIIQRSPHIAHKF